MNAEPLTYKSDDTMGGMRVFYGTRVPVQHLIDYLAEGLSVDEFLDAFPTVGAEQVQRFLTEAAEQWMATAPE